MFPGMLTLVVFNCLISWWLAVSAVPAVCSQLRHRGGARFPSLTSSRLLSHIITFVSSTLGLSHRSVSQATLTGVFSMTHRYMTWLLAASWLLIK